MIEIAARELYMSLMVRDWRAAAAGSVHYLPQKDERASTIFGIRQSDPYI